MPVRFQVDPDFYDHPKSIGMSDAAVALWTRAGSYSAAKLTDGFIAEHVLVTLSRTPEEAATELTRRGLWKRVRGGYRFHQWEQRNLVRARVEEDREADRERKRRKREEARTAAGTGTRKPGRPKNPQANPNSVREDSERTPDGIEPDSEGIPGSSVSVSLSVSESVSGSGRPPGEGSAGPPPARCDDHLDTPTPVPCGACADRRRAREQYDRDQAAILARVQSERAREQAAAARAAIDACRLCDQHGQRDGRLCLHDPDMSTRSRRGAELAAAAIRRPTQEKP